MFEEAYYAKCDNCGVTTSPDISKPVLEERILKAGWRTVLDYAPNGEICRIHHLCFVCKVNVDL